MAQYGKWLLQICYNLLKALGRRFSPDSKRDITREELLNELTLDAVGQHAYGRRQAPPDEIMAALENAGQLEAALGQLAPDERQIVAWRYHDGLTLAAIAKRLDLSIDAVKRRCQRALAVLKRRLR